MTFHFPRLVRRTDPATSVKAVDSITEETVADSKDEVEYLLTSYGPMADHELVERHEREVYLHPEYRRYSPQRLRTARNELWLAGRVLVFGYTKTPSRRTAIIWAHNEETK
jgi:hypothetical protein